MPKIQPLEQTAKQKQGNSFNTLAQLPTDVRAKFQKLGGKKYHTYNIVSELLKLNTPLKKGYIRTLGCTDIFEERNGNFKSKLCRNRACIHCNNIKTANLINGYKKEIQPKIENGDVYLLTLTRKSVSSRNLRSTIQEMNKNFSNIIRVLNEKRNWGISGIRVIEVTNAPLTDSGYHPHIHALIWGDNLPTNFENIIFLEWQKRYGSILASKKGYDIKKANSNSFKELFKYVTKMSVSKIDKKTKTFYPEIINTTLVALHRLRTIQSFGKLKKEIIPKEPKIIVIEAKTIETRRFMWNEKDWHCTDDVNLVLSGNKQETKYVPLKMPIPIGELVKKYVVKLKNSG